MTRVHIHARDIALFDAVGNFTQQIATLLVHAGYDPMLWAENYTQCGKFKIHHRAGFFDNVESDDVVLFNHSIFDPILPDIVKLSQRKLLYFHNITHPDLIHPSERETIENCRKGLEQIPLFALFDRLMTNSSLTLNLVKDVLGEAMPSAQVVAPVIGLDRLRLQASQRSTTAPILLCVGRLVPHKKTNKVIEVFSFLKRDWPDLELFFVGGPSGGPFVEMLKKQAKAVSPLIHFIHDISDEELSRLYSRATACINLSVHEGFCVPALEALCFDKPFFCGPMPPIEEILGDAFLNLPQAPEAAAAKLKRTLDDPQIMNEHAKRRGARREHWKHLASGQSILENISKVTSQ